MGHIRARTSCLARIVVGLTIAATDRDHDLCTNLRPRSAYAEVIGDAASVAVREVTPLVRFARYASKATTNRHVYWLALHGHFHGASADNSQQNDDGRDNDGAHLNP